MTRIHVPPEAAGSRLDAFLAEPLGSRARAQRLLEAGRVLVDGDRVAKRRRLTGGETIEVEEDDERAAAAAAPPPDLVIPFADEHLLVVDKPAGLVVHPARGHRENTLAQLLAGSAAGGPDPERAGIVHRLDRDTSGLLVVARSERAHRALQEALRARLIEREYLALVEGQPPARTGTIDAPLGRDRRIRTRISVDTADPREAVTHFAIEEALAQWTLLRVRLETGRTHQIRAHLKAIGHPVAGDPEYGRAGVLDLERQFLHAARLAFPHPLTGEPVEVTSALPVDLDQALDRART